MWHERLMYVKWRVCHKQCTNNPNRYNTFLFWSSKYSLYRRFHLKLANESFWVAYGNLKHFTTECAECEAWLPHIQHIQSHNNNQRHSSQCKAQPGRPPATFQWICSTFWRPSPHYLPSTKGGPRGHALKKKQGIVGGAGSCWTKWRKCYLGILWRYSSSSGV